MYVHDVDYLHCFRVQQYPRHKLSVNEAKESQLTDYNLILTYVSKLYK